MTALWLATGSTSTADAVNLLADKPGAPRCMAIEGGLSLQAIDPETPPSTRALGLQLFMDAPTADAYWATVRAIRRKLEQAARALGAGDVWIGTPVCLWMLLGSASNYVYWDVTGGTLTQQPADYGDRAGLWTLTLAVLPYARGPAVALPVSGTLTNGNAGIWVPNIPGDTDALCRLTLTDVSTGGVVINRVRLGRRSLPGMAQTDFAPVIEAVAATETLPTAYVLSLGGATGGTFTLSFGGQTTAAQANTVTAAALGTAFGGLSSVGVANVVISGSGSVAAPFVIQFAGSLAATQQGNITIASSLTGGTGAVLSRAASAVVSDATATGGSTTRLMAIGGYRSIGQTVAASTGLQPGRYDLWARLRDASVIAVGKPTISSLSGFTGGDGTLTGSTITVEVVEVDATGNLSLPSNPVSITLSGGNSLVQVAVTSVGTPTTYRVYFKQDANPWKYFGGINTVPYNLSTNAGATSGNPPTQATTVGNIQVLPLFALDAPSPFYVLGRATTTVLGNGQWEFVYLGAVVLPPMAEWENQALTNPSYQVLLQAQLGSVSATPATIDWDYLLLLPHEEPQQRLEVTAQNLATARVWVSDTRRDGRASAVLTDGTGTVQGQVNKVGAFTLGPGNNLVLVDVSVAGQVHDVVNAKYTVQITYVPRYEFATGLYQ